MSNPKKKGGLGTGLDALFGVQGAASVVDIELNAAKGLVTDTTTLPLEDIEPNPEQPRRDFDQAKLDELAASIKAQGVVTPIIVRKFGRKYQIIAGERRYRASKLLGLKDIPVRIITVSDEVAQEIALIENVQREDLNPIEIALSYQKLIDICKLTHETISERVGKNRSTITNYLRLLNLPEEVQLALRDNQISMGHARAIIGLKDEALQKKAVKRIITEGLSVRQVEGLARDKDIATALPTAKKEKNHLPENFEKHKQHLANMLSAKVDFQVKDNKGKLIIHFNSDKDLDNILSKIR